MAQYSECSGFSRLKLEGADLALEFSLHSFFCSGSNRNLVFHDFWLMLSSFSGWMDDSGLAGEQRLSSKYNQGTFTTGRTRPSKPGKETVFTSQRSQESVLPPAPGPGKLNMADYHHVSSALSRLNMKPSRGGAPLAGQDDDGGVYADPQDVINNGQPSEYAQPMLQDQHRPKPRSKNRERRERAKIGEHKSTARSSTSF